MVRGWAALIRAASPTPWVGELACQTVWTSSLPAVQTMLDFANHPAGKSAKPEQFVDNSVIAELEKSGFIDRLYKQ